MKAETWCGGIDLNERHLNRILKDFVLSDQLRCGRKPSYHVYTFGMPMTVMVERRMVWDDHHEDGGLIAGGGSCDPTVIHSDPPHSLSCIAGLAQ